MLQQTLLYILTGISGLFFGSFLNLVSDRLPKGEKILLGRSKCDFCKKPLNPKNLIPLFSYIFQKGKCSYCKKKLSLYYPISEILTALVYVGVAIYSRVFTSTNYSSVLIFFYLITIASFYIIIFLSDLKFKIIPNKVVYPAIVITILFLISNTTYFFYTYYQQLKNDSFGVYLLKAGYLNLQIYNSAKAFLVLFVSAAGIALFFQFLIFITKGRGMGGGDVKLGFLIGVFNGFPLNIVAIFLGFILGASVSIILVMLKIKSLKDTVPFGPFLILGSVITLLWGPTILQFYLNLF